MSIPVEQYVEAGIWTMQSTRETCVVPERPLMITESEERALGGLALSAWNALENIVAMVNENPQEPWRQLGRKASVFAEGATMPPAVRIDVVRTNTGPKIIEVDPTSAISLGETISLIDIWQEQGYAVPDGLLEEVARVSSGKLGIAIPREKQAYVDELSYLERRLAENGVQVNGDAERQLSAFSDVPSIARALNRDGWNRSVNPLWGSLNELSFKDNLALLQCGDKINYPQYLPQLLDEATLAEMDPQAMVVAKPRKGTGSMGVKAVRIADIVSLPEGMMFQEKLTPLVDDFGLDQPYVSRVSVYAGAKGLLGAQVTARPFLANAPFTNVHGQADAVQTTIAIR